MALGKQADLPDDLLEFRKLATDWCVREQEIDIPLAKLIEFSSVVSPATTNRALHVARICRAVKGGLLLAMHPKELVSLPYIAPEYVDLVIFRIPRITDKLDMEAVSKKRAERKEREKTAVARFLHAKPTEEAA